MHTLSLSEEMCMGLWHRACILDGRALYSPGAGQLRRNPRENCRAFKRLLSRQGPSSQLPPLPYHLGHCLITLCMYQACPEWLDTLSGTWVAILFSWHCFLLEAKGRALRTGALCVPANRVYPGQQNQTSQLGPAELICLFSFLQPCTAEAAMQQLGILKCSVFHVSSRVKKQIIVCQ